MLPNVDNFQEIGIDAIFGQEAPKGGLVELGGAGRHHQAVQTELLDIAGYILLARLGARIEMVPAHRDPRPTPGLVRQGLRADNPGNVVPAVTNVKADARGVVHSYRQAQVVALIESEGEKAKREKGEKGKRNRIIFMDWSLMNWKTSVILSG